MTGKKHEELGNTVVTRTELVTQRRKIEEQLEKAGLDEERRKKARDSIESVKTVVRDVAEETEVQVYVPEIMTKISKMLENADESFRFADYEETMKLSFEIKELVEKARLEAFRKAEEKRRRRKEEAKYFYCIIPHSKEKSFGNIGMNNDEVYTIPYRDVAAVISDSPLRDYELTEDCTRKHEAVLRQVMEEQTVIPVEFGATIKNIRILRRLLAKAFNPVRECLRLVDNAVELGLKAVLNEDIMFANPEKRKECVSDILASLNTIAKDVVTGDLFSNRLILNASFLVNKEDIDAISDKVTELQEKYPMLKLLYTGPWAPYNFVYIQLGAKGIEVTKK